MTETGTLQITTPTEREIVMSRVFDAPRNLVFDAWTRPGMKLPSSNVLAAKRGADMMS